MRIIKHPARSHWLRSRSRAFTLIEVLLAVTIFAVTMVAVGSAVHTSVRAWRVGHGISEITETARLTQDVLARDLNNLIYMPEGAYNRVFRQQVQTLARQQLDLGRGGVTRPRRNEQRRNQERQERQRELTERDRNQPGAQVGPNSELTLDQLAVPIDLSFRATNSEKADELSFARLQPARWDTDPETGGIRRVRYYLREKTLYREETDPFGSRSGGVFSADPEDEFQSALYELLQLYRRDDDRPPAGSNAGWEPDAAMKAELASTLPARVTYAEPICEGVEIFDFSFGYFKNGEWWEVQDWDSDAQRYRDPPEVDAGEERDARRRGKVAGLNIPGFAPQDLTRAMDNSENQQDHLPGYIAIQLGVRSTDGKGRLHSFTFYHPLPIGQENDMFDIDRINEGPPPQGVQVSELGGRAVSHERHRSAFERRQDAREQDMVSALGGQSAVLPGVPPGWSVGGAGIGGTETRY